VIHYAIIQIYTETETEATITRIMVVSLHKVVIRHDSVIKPRF